MTNERLIKESFANVKTHPEFGTALAAAKKLDICYCLSIKYN
jgi:hypothetical protein